MGGGVASCARAKGAARAAPPSASLSSLNVAFSTGMRQSPVHAIGPVVAVRCVRYRDRRCLPQGERCQANGQTRQIVLNQMADDCCQAFGRWLQAGEDGQVVEQPIPEGGGDPL